MVRRVFRTLIACALGCVLLVGALTGQETVIAFLEARLAGNPRDVDALEALGLEHLRRGDHTGAFIQLQKALAVDPNRGTTYYYLGLLYFEKGLYFKEIEAYEKAVFLLPDYREARLNLAHAYLSVGKIPEAVTQYELVRRSDPGNLTVLYNLGIVLADLNRTTEAKRFLTDYLRLASRTEPARAKAVEVLADIDRQAGGGQ